MNELPNEFEESVVDQKIGGAARDNPKKSADDNPEVVRNNSGLHWIKGTLDIEDFLGVEKIRSAEENNVTKIETSKGVYIVKQGPNLADEKNRLVWLDGKLPVPKVIAWQDDKAQQTLLMSYIEGRDFAQFSRNLPKDETVNLLAGILHLIHNVDITDCPFGEKNEGSVFIHGDACLPNFIYDNGKLHGIIDLGKAGIGDREDDLAAAVWSLDYNYGPGLGALFLKAYGITSPTEKDAERLKCKYEDDWTERF